MDDISDMDVYLQIEQKAWKHPDAAVALSIMLLLAWKPWTIQATKMWTQ